MLATLSILGSLKTQAAVTILIPMIAMGLPLLDAIWSAVRRFSAGRRISDPDKAHFHHKLLYLGISQRSSVLILYAGTIILGAVALFLVHARDDRAALILLLVGVALILGIRKLGYPDHFPVEGFILWAKGISDEVGFSRERRGFFGLQTNILRTRTIQDLWKNITRALEMLEFDKGSLYLNASLKNEELRGQMKSVSFSNSTDRRGKSPIESSVIMRKSPPEMDWVRPPFAMEDYVCSRRILRLELPLLGKHDTHFGTLVLVKDMRLRPITHQTLRRVEDLRLTVIRALEQMDKPLESQVSCSAVPHLEP